MDQENQKNVSLEEYWTILRERRWYVIVPTFACWLAIWAVSWILPSSYRSETLILVERQKVPQQYVVPNVAVDLQERLQSMTQQILSRTRLQRIIDDFHLYQGDRSSLGPDQIVDKMRKDISIELVQAPGDRHELTAFKIAYSAPSPRLAQQVTSELTSLFIDENLQAGQQQAEDTTAFLENQMNEARKNLEQQEEKLRQYKMGYLGQLPEQMQSNLQILAGLQSQLQSANEGLHQAQQQKVYLDSLASGYKSLSAGLSPQTSGGEDKAERLEHLKSQLADLSAKYTDDYPDVKRLKSEIAKLEKQSSSTGGSKNGDVTAHPATLGELQAMSPMMQVQGQIKANQAEIENRQKEIKDLQTQIGSYQSRLNMTPLREQQLSDLTRDHQQALDNYNSLLEKEMQSKLATNLEKRQQGETFRIIDPPTLPQRSSSPDRLMFSLAGVAVGLVLGLALILAIEFIQQRIRSEREFLEILPVSILTELPIVMTSKEGSRRKKLFWVEAAAACVLTIIVSAGTFISYYRG